MARGTLESPTYDVKPSLFRMGEASVPAFDSAILAGMHAVPHHATETGT